LTCITPDVSYCLRCNTDVTSLLSGTAIKAVVAYISDYVTKASLKIYHIFHTVRDVLEKNTVPIGSSAQGTENTRILVMKMVNSLSSKLQIGSPMACLYILNNPDRYTNKLFKVFGWKWYIAEVRRDWPSTKDNSPEDEQVLVMNKDSKLVGVSIVDDYKYRPTAFENTSLLEYTLMVTRVKRNPKQFAEFKESLKDRPANIEMPLADPLDNDNWLEDDLEEAAESESVGDRSDAVSIHPFLKGHELYETHYIRCDRRNLETTCPNFVGGALPRMDQGDREYYCCTMLTLFKPWRRGKDLKTEVDNWDEAFRDYKFSAKALMLMKNFNVRYECNDARDDFSAQERKRRRVLPMFSRWQDVVEEEETEDGYVGTYGEEAYDPPMSELTLGPKYISRRMEMEAAESFLHKSGWTQNSFENREICPRFVPEKRISGAQWKVKLNQAKETILNAKYRRAPTVLKRRELNKRVEPERGNHVTLLNSYYFTKYFIAKNKKAQKVVQTVSTEFNLNPEQKRAFQLVANHA
ncbi:hypothetical protein FB451DRAFT_1000339, partial [Mycena latifolia]